MKTKNVILVIVAATIVNIGFWQFTQVKPSSPSVAADKVQHIQPQVAEQKSSPAAVTQTPAVVPAAPAPAQALEQRRASALERIQEAMSDPQAALAWAQALPQDRARDQALLGVVQAWSQMSPSPKLDTNAAGNKFRDPQPYKEVNGEMFYAQPIASDTNVR